MQFNKFDIETQQAFPGHLRRAAAGGKNYLNGTNVASLLDMFLLFSWLQSSSETSQAPRASAYPERLRRSGQTTRLINLS
ncbi:hypothetical protein [Stutzerimonas urumqiensis]|uniref:hypothetical protein n=1 Tax=Stutzerimonas urumqiensis TaxID=638269 RepID=UPI0013CF0A9E|nr:hypothetical protein [Stutzerimonas urumqiensis]